MKALLLAVLLAMGGESWSVRIINEFEMIILNELNRSIICYVYYDDGDFKKIFVRPGKESKPFPQEGLLEVECF